MLKRTDTDVCAVGVLSYTRLRPSDRLYCQCNVQ